LSFGKKRQRAAALQCCNGTDGIRRGRIVTIKQDAGVTELSCFMAIQCDLVRTRGKLRHQQHQYERPRQKPKAI
jgi:hypothetical protein